MPAKAVVPLNLTDADRRKVCQLQSWRRQARGLRSQAIAMRIHYRRPQRSNPMRLQVKRLDSDGRYETVITRNDGVSFRVLGVAHTRAIPHDLAHYVVEKALKIEDGFWGSIAAGAVFPTMTYLGGRRRPQATERSRTLLKANARALVDAEIVVCIFNGTIEQGHSENSAVLAGRLRDRLPRPGKKLRPISPSDIAEVYSAYKVLRQDWERVPIGGTLVRQW